MKKLITIITICLMISSCKKHTNIVCPCVVIHVERKDSNFYIETKGKDSEYSAILDNGVFSFFTNYEYKTGDTIK